MCCLLQCQVEHYLFPGQLAVKSYVTEEEEFKRIQTVLLQRSPHLTAGEVKSKEFAVWYVIDNTDCKLSCKELNPTDMDQMLVVWCCVYSMCALGHVKSNICSHFKLKCL